MMGHPSDTPASEVFAGTAEVGVSSPVKVEYRNFNVIRATQIQLHRGSSVLEVR